MEYVVMLVIKSSALSVLSSCLGGGYNENNEIQWTSKREKMVKPIATSY